MQLLPRIKTKVTQINGQIERQDSLVNTLLHPERKERFPHRGDNLAVSS